MIKISPNIILNPAELKFSFIRAPGPGGQNVNKVATAVQLRFNIAHASLPENLRTRLLSKLSHKITAEGDVIIKASSYRTQERNKQDACDRLEALLNAAAIVPKKRKKTRPTLASQERRLSEKKLHAKHKSLRRIKSYNEQ